MGIKKSLEKDMLPAKVLNQKIMGVVDSSDLFLDFGTPEFYDGVEEFLGHYFPDLRQHLILFFPQNFSHSRTNSLNSF